MAAFYPKLKIDLTRLEKVHNLLKSTGLKYALGAKWFFPFVKPKTGYVDCSGYVGGVLSLATDDEISWEGLGTWHLNERMRLYPLEKCKPEDAGAKDGVLRCAIMLAGNGVSIGHTCLILNGVTYESYGGHGVGNRVWTGKGWQGRSTVYVLTARPTTQKGG